MAKDIEKEKEELVEEELTEKEEIVEEAQETSEDSYEEAEEEKKKKLTKEEKKAEKAAKKEEKAAKKAEKEQEKLDAKREKAEEKKKEIVAEVRELKAQIAEEKDEKKKKKLRRKRDYLIAQRDGIMKSKDGMTIPMPVIVQKRIKACVAIVIVIALLFAYLQTGFVRHGLMSSLSVPQKVFVGMVVTDGEGTKHSIKVNTYNYYYANAYNQLRQTQSLYEQYGYELPEDQKVDFSKKLSQQYTTNEAGESITWEDYLHDQVLESIRTTYMYYYEAVKANDGNEPAITEDQQKSIDDLVADYTSSAETYHYTVDGYLTVVMGKGVNEECFRREQKISYISQNYQTEYKEELSNKLYTEEDYTKYRDEHEDDLKSVDIKYFECSTEDEAKAFKKALKEDGSNFAALAAKYSTTDWDKTENKNDYETIYNSATRDKLIQMNGAIAQAETDKDGNSTYPGLDWVFSDKRKAGDIKQTSTSVVYIITPARYSETKTVTVRHILITPFTETTDENGEVTETETEASSATEATEEEWTNAKKKADKILKEYEDGKKTEDDFNALAKKYSKDTGTSANGGLMEYVSPSETVGAFDNWCFAKNRKAGDVEIVKTEFGYHLIYFVKTNDLNAWQRIAQQALASTDSTTTLEALDAAYTIRQTWLGSRYFEIDTDIDYGTSD